MRHEFAHVAVEDAFIESGSEDMLRAPQAWGYPPGAVGALARAPPAGQIAAFVASCFDQPAVGYEAVERPLGCPFSERRVVAAKIGARERDGLLHDEKEPRDERVQADGDRV